MKLQSFIHLQNWRCALIIKSSETLSKFLTENRWIKHPTAVTRSAEKQIRIPQFFINLGATGREPKKTPQLCILLTGTHCFAATRSTFSSLKEKVSNMVYKFLVARRQSRLAKLSSIRIVKVQAKNELSARAMFSGIPLVFLSCAPEGALA